MNDADFVIDAGNPLDSVADFLVAKDWVYERPHADELVLTLMGQANAYRLTFLWQGEFSALQLFCEYDLEIAPEQQSTAAEALRAINGRLWLGHFDLPASGLPVFRHTSLLRGWAHESNAHRAEPIEDLVEIALAECERHQNIFHLLSHPHPLDTETISLMLRDDAGQA